MSTQVSPIARLSRRCVSLAQCGWLTLVLLLLATASAAGITAPDTPAPDTVITVHNKDSYEVTPFTSLLKDSTGHWSLQDILAPENAAQFRPVDQNILTFGLTKNTYWIKFKLRYSDKRKKLEAEKEWFLELERAQMNIAELYILREDGSIERQSSDLRTRLDQRPLLHVNSIFPVTTTRNETITLYLRVQNNAAFYMPLKLRSAADLIVKAANEEAMYGIYFGGMLIIILYNLFIYFSVRDASYIYYVCYLASALAFESIDNGHGGILFERHINWISKEHIPIAVLATWCSGLLFTLHFLDIRRRHPLLNQFFQPFLVFSFIALGLSFLVPFDVALQFAVYFCGNGSVAVWILSSYCWYKGNKNASFYTFAWIFNIGGFVTYGSVSTGLIPATPLFIYSYLVGTWMESVLLAFALAERIKRTQQEVLEARHRAMFNLLRYRSIFDNAVEGIYQMTLNGKLIDANLSMAKILGFESVNSLLRRKRFALTTFFNDPRKQWPLLAKYRKLRTEFQNKTAAGEPCFAVHSAQLIVDKRGNPLHIEGTLLDITERKHREKAMRERLRERREKELAKASTEGKSQFLKNMSYEIRTPLTAIIGFSESLRDSSLSPELRKAAVASVTQNSLQLLQLINDILDFSKIEAGKMAVESIPVDTLALIIATHDQFAPLAREKQLEFKLDCRFPLPEKILSDPTRLKQILQNLCSNAIKYTPKGTITLMTYWDESRQQLCFCVVDTGIGLDQQKIRALTGAGVNNMQQSLDDMGLGLAITRQLTTLLGGVLEIESLQGRGSRFTAAIGCKITNRSSWATALPTPAPTAPTPSSSTPTFAGTVLLAEDNPVNQKLIARVISKTGATVQVVDNGQLALDAGLVKTYDLILVDVNMPVMGGLEATQALRQAGYTGPIYALTAEQGEQEVRASLNAGCNGHLTKPLDIPAFYATLSKHLTPKVHPIAHQK